MSDSRYHGATFVGAPLTRQQALNQRHRDYCDNHPASYGWTVASVAPDGLIIWANGGALMRRHPAGDCWLVFWMNCWQPIDLHISELSEKLESLKLAIEFEIAKEEFAADIETMAA